MREQASVEVKVPAGVDTGTRLKLSGEGEPAAGGVGPPGDLYVVVQVREHPIFKREETEILCEVPLSFTQAALGATIDVPTLDGPSKLKIPAGTQSGKVFRLKGKGVPSLQGNGRGDQHVRVFVETPTHLSREQRDLLERFAAALRRRDQPPVQDLLAEGLRPPAEVAARPAHRAASAAAGSAVDPGASMLSAGRRFLLVLLLASPPAPTACWW